MKEHLNRPEEEMIAAYGEDLDARETLSSAELDQFEGATVSNAEAGAVSSAEAYLAGHSPEEQEAAEQISSNIASVYEKIGGDDLLASEKAAESLLGSAFAAAPTSQSELAELPLWKRVVTGATAGARGAAKAVALAATLSVPAAAQDYRHPSPEITKKVDYIFGSSVMERFGDRRGQYKKAYTHLEVRKKALLQQLRELTDGRPQSTAEAAHIQRVEADRDAKLAALNVERTLETMAFQNLNSSNPADRAQYEANIASIAAREARVIEECEAQLLKEHREQVPAKAIEDLRREIIRIESSQDQIVQRFLSMQNSSYGSNWGSGWGGGWTQWDGYK